MKRYVRANGDWLEHYDANIEPEIFEFCDELGGYADYNQKVEYVAEEWNMTKDLAEEYVWNWCIQHRLDDEEEG